MRRRREGVGLPRDDVIHVKSAVPRGRNQLRWRNHPPLGGFLKKKEAILPKSGFLGPGTPPDRSGTNMGGLMVLISSRLGACGPISGPRMVSAQLILNAINSDCWVLWHDDFQFCVPILV